MLFLKALAIWTLVAASSNRKIYADFDRRTYSEKTQSVHIWEKWTYNEPQQILDKGKTVYVSHVIAEVYYDCKTPVSAVLEHFYYDVNGEVVDTWKWESGVNKLSFKTLVPESIGEEAWRRACKGQ